MLMVAIEQARAGMRLVMAIRHPEQPDQELLRPGFVLDEKVLARLRSMGVPYVYVDYPELAELDRHLMPHLSPARQSVYTHMKNTIAAVQKTARPTATFPDYYVSTRELILTLLESGQHPIYVDVLSAGGSDAVEHATTVAHLALTIGLRLQTYIMHERSRLPARHAREVVNLGVAGMLHDVGKAKLRPELQKYTCVHPPEDPGPRAEWEAHCRIGAEMIRHGVESSASASVLQHHQHFDGGGFPPIARPRHDAQALRDHQIHVFARIIRAADLYDRLSMGPKGRRMPVEILELIKTKYSQWIDPKILDVLPRVIPPFPPGCRVELTDGASAVVTRVDPEDPYRPVVRRLGEDMTLAGEPVLLARQPELRIKRVGKLEIMPEAQAA